MFRFALGAAVALSAVPALSAVNLVQNGSFEDGLAHWQVGGIDTQGFAPVAIHYGAAQAYPVGAYGEAVPVANAPTNSPDPAGGRAAYFVSDFTQNQSLSQQVYLAAGTYQIGFSAYAPHNGYGNAGDAAFSGTIAGVTLASYAVSAGPAATWQSFQGAVNIAADGFYAVDFVFNTNAYPSKDVVIDRVYIIEGNPAVPGVPEPAMWAMLVSGFGLVGMGARRRRKMLVAA